MMISEFIERTGFEPIGAEYQEIEAEYMGCDMDKDKFCREWKKKGGIQRLCRIRARRIEELEAEVKGLEEKVRLRDEDFERMDVKHCKQFNQMRKDMQEKLDKKTAEYESAVKLNNQILAERDALRKNLDKIREAFAIFGIAKEVA